MSVISPLWTAALRRHWPVIGAFTIFIVFLLVNMLWFEPTAKRYDRAINEAADLGLSLDPEHATPVLPPRLFALISDNSLPAAEAQDRGTSGELTADLIALLSRIANERDLNVLSTEPGPTTQQATSVQVRTHFRIRGRYQDFVGWLDDLVATERLISIDRFSMSSLPDGQAFIEIWASRYILKRTKGNR